MGVPMLTASTVLKATPWCVVREQEERYLVHNSRTDELHLLPPTAFYVYGLCNGWRSFEEIEGELRARMREEPGLLLDGLRKLCAMLLERGLVEIEV